MPNLEQYIHDNKTLYEGVAYLKTSIETLSESLGLSESTVKRSLAKLIDEGKIVKVSKRGHMGGIALFEPEDLDNLRLVKKTKTNENLLDILFPKTGTYEPKGIRRTKEEMSAYKAEQLQMSKKLQQDNKIFTDALSHFNAFDYNETFGKLDTAKEVYRVFLASRVYDTYAIAFDERYVSWYKEDSKLGDKVKWTRGRARSFHQSSYRTLKIPFLGTRAYTFAKKLVDTADSLKISVPAYVYNVMERYAWKNASGYSKPYIPSLNQITDVNHVDMVQRYMVQREYDWLQNGHQYSYYQLENTDVMYAVSSYMLFTDGGELTPNDIEPNITQTAEGTAYGNFYDSALNEISKLNLSDNERFWYNQYVKEQVSLATGSISRAYKRTSPILAYLVNSKGGVMDTYKEWVKEDGGMQEQASQDLYASTGKDIKAGYGLSKELYEEEVIKHLDDIISIHKEAKQSQVRDLMSLELTRKNRYVRLNIQKLIKDLTPILGLSDSGFINRTEIMNEWRKK